MKTQLDTKSILLGLLLGIIATIGIAATHHNGQVGRYQIMGTERYGWIVDTATGEAWSSQHNHGRKTPFYKPKLGPEKK